MKINSIAIVGMGALGMLYGDFLMNKMGADAVSFIAGPERIARYSEQAFTVNGKPFSFNLVPAGAKNPADLVIFAVKANALEQAMADAAGYIGEHTAILSVLNGIVSEQLLEERFGRKNVVYCVGQGMDAVKIGAALTFTKMGHLCVGVPDDEKLPALDAVCRLFDETGMPYVREDDILHRLWGKFMLNVGVNQVVMVHEGTYGTIQVPGKPRDMMIAAMREVIALSEKEGTGVTEADLEFYLNILAPLSPEGMPSMRQDGLAKRPSEVELFSGTVCRLAKKHGIPVPVNEWLYRRVKEMEAAY